MKLPFDVATAVIAIVFVITFYVMKNYVENWKVFGKIAGPPFRPLPLFGHVLRYRDGKEEFYSNLTQRLNDDVISQGHEVGCAWIGPKPVIMVVGPNAVEVLLRSSKHMEKGFLYQFMREWLGTGLLTSKGEKWAKRRKLLTPTFHFSILQDFLSVMNEQALVFTSKLETYAKEKVAFDIFAPVTLCALDIICETAMGKKINAQSNSKSDYVIAVYDISEAIWKRSLSPWLWWSPFFAITPTGRKYFKSLHTLHDFSRTVIRERIKNFSVGSTEQKKRLAFLDLLLKASEGGKVLEFSDIQEEVDTFMFEGHDTTAAAMSWAIFLIGSHPDVQKKVQDELDQVLGKDPNRKILPDDLKKFKYLDLTIKECLRCLPSVPVIGRTTSEECIMDGHQIPAGTECIILPQLISNLEKFWPEPDRFDPERFTKDNMVGKHPYAYIPFSAGPRNCIGQKFATMEEKVMLGHLFRTFTVEVCDKREELLLLGDVILRPGSGVNVRLKKRVFETDGI